MNKKNIFTLLLCFGLLFSTSMTVLASEIESDEISTYTEKNESSISLNTGDILNPVESVDEQLEGLSENQRRIA